MRTHDRVADAAGLLRLVVGLPAEMLQPARPCLDSIQNQVAADSLPSHGIVLSEP